MNEFEYEMALNELSPEHEWELLTEFEEPESTTRRSPSPPSPRLMAEVRRHRDRHNRLMRAVEAMRKHVAVRNGRLHFTLPAQSTREAAAKLGIDHGLFSHLHDAIKKRNLHAGRLGLRLPQRAQGPSRATISAEVELESKPLCAGVTKTEKLWWGLRLWLDECKTGALVESLLGGTTAAGLCLFLGPEAAPICAAVIAVLTQGEGRLINAVDKLGGNQGVVLAWTWAQVAAVPAVVAGGGPIVAAGLQPTVTSQSAY
jgi:hypothetical protein